MPELPPKVTLATANPADADVVAEVAAGVTGNGVIEQQAAHRLDARQASSISCGFNRFRCYTRLEPGQRVVLIADPLPRYVFQAWTGACAGQGPRCVVVARALKTVTAIFAPRTPLATVGLSIRPLAVRIRWRRSVGQGGIFVVGCVGGPAKLRVQLRRPHGGPLLTRRFSTGSGCFRKVIPLRKDALPRGARVLPGGFVVSIAGSSGDFSLPFQLRPLVIPAPVEGVVRLAFTSAVEAGPTTGRLPGGAPEAWAHFRFATQPTSRLPISVAWYWPNGRLLGSVEKANRPEIVSFLRLASGLPSGVWTAEVRVGETIASRHNVRIG